MVSDEIESDHGYHQRSIMISSHRMFIAALTLYATVSYAILHNVHNAVHTVIDEEFHIPQGMAYCNFNISAWNRKITTLPGLYIVSTILLGPLRLCGTYWLRFVSFLAGIINTYLFSILFGVFDQKIGDREKLEGLLSAFNLSILPPLFFFTNLYYTDVVSITFVLLLLILNRANRHVLASVCGLFSVIVRQTNIIWVGMLFVDYILKQVKAEDASSFRIDSVQNVEKRIKNASNRILVDVGSYVSVMSAFVIFLIVNQGIAVGDRSAHTTVVHIPQLFYFSTFCLIFAWPHFLHLIVPFVKYFYKKGPPYTISAMAIVAIIVRANTLVHPYLLADNRHYTFYVWKRFYENMPLFRYAVIPVYLFGLYSLVCSVRSRNDVTFALAYLPCTAFVLVLQKMIEVRYFLTPFLIFRTNIRQRSMKLLLAESLTYLTMNIVAFTIFFTKNIYWNDYPYIQKLIW
ncbi:hypothetical protein Trydic_g21014 [Trypoxylus dichotomus]